MQTDALVRLLEELHQREASRYNSRRFGTYNRMGLSSDLNGRDGRDLSVSIFAGAMPSGPIARAAAAGAEILVYVGGQLAFTGVIGSARTSSEKGQGGTGG